MNLLEDFGSSNAAMTAWTSAECGTAASCACSSAVTHSKRSSLAAIAATKKIRLVKANHCAKF